MNSILLAAGAAGATNWMTKIFMPLYWLFGKCMFFLMELCSNEYFIALLLFTVLTRLVLFPLNVKQQKTMAKSNRLQPKIQKIQKKYPNPTPQDRQRMNEEMQALYAREGHNPMSMGCGAMVFQMLFLMGIIGIIYYPIQYIMGVGGGFDSAIFDEIATAVGYEAGKDGTYFQLWLVSNFEQFKNTLVTQFGDLFTPDKVKMIEAYRESMNIFGIDLSVNPSWKSITVIIPLASFLSSLASSIMSMQIQKKTNPAAAQQQGMSMKLMMLTMPLFSLFIAFQVTGAVGIYWVISNFVAIIQQLVIAKFFPPKKSQARLMIENTIERRSREENVKKIK